MLFTTPPDMYDKHQHMLETDDFGDGVTDEGGNPPHVHEASNGAVLPFVAGKYQSLHNGPLILVDSGENEEGEDGDDYDDSDDMEDEDAQEESYLGGLLDYIAENMDDVDDIAERLMIEGL